MTLLLCGVAFKPRTGKQIPYIGIDGGYRFGNDPFSQTVVQPGGTAASFEKSVVAPKGGFFGGQMGYNWQVGSVVLGVEGDAQWSGQRDRA